MTWSTDTFEEKADSNQGPSAYQLNALPLGQIHAYICAQKRCRKASRATICTAQCVPQSDHLHGTVRSAERPFARHSAFRGATICTAQCVPRSDHLHGAERPFARHSAFRGATICTVQCVPQSDHLHGTVRSAERPFARHSAFRGATICTAQCGQVSGHMHGTVRSVERQLAWQNATDWEARHSVLREATVFTAEGVRSLKGKKRPFSRSSAVRSQTRKPSLL